MNDVTTSILGPADPAMLPVGPCENASEWHGHVEGNKLIKLDPNDKIPESYQEYINRLTD